MSNESALQYLEHHNSDKDTGSGDAHVDPVATESSVIPLPMKLESRRALVEFRKFAQFSSREMAAEMGSLQLKVQSQRLQQQQQQQGNLQPLRPHHPNSNSIHLGSNLSGTSAASQTVCWSLECIRHTLQRSVVSSPTMSVSTTDGGTPQQTVLKCSYRKFLSTGSSIARGRTTVTSSHCSHHQDPVTASNVADSIAQLQTIILFLQRLGLAVSLIGVTKQGNRIDQTFVERCSAMNQQQQGVSDESKDDHVSLVNVLQESMDRVDCTIQFENVFTANSILEHVPPPGVLPGLYRVEVRRALLQEWEQCISKLYGCQVEGTPLGTKCQVVFV